MNITLDDTSPQFQYLSRSNGWLTNHTDDTFTDKYFDSTFHGTYTDGDSVSLTFNGSAIYIYGGHRPNHGVFSTQIDGGSVSYAIGQSTTSELQQLLFSAGGLSADREHTVVLKNEPSQTSPPANATIQWWFDVDFAVITTHTTGQIYTTTYDDTNAAITYSGTGWSTGPPLSPASYHDSTAHISEVVGNSWELAFNGSSIQIFGGLFSDHGNYSVSLDGGNAKIYNGTYFQLATQVSLYQANNLTDGLHKVTLVNIGAGPAGNFVDFDYAVVNSTINPDGSSNASTAGNTTSTSIASSETAKSGGSSVSAGAIAGGVVGGVVGLASVVVLAWFLFRRSKKQQDDYHFPKRMEGMDLNGEEIKPYQHGPLSTAFTQPTVADSEHGYSTGDPHSPSARETDLTHTPFLMRVPPPPPSNATSYPRSVYPPSSVGSPPPVPAMGNYGNPFTGGSDSTGNSPTFAQQQGPTQSQSSSSFHPPSAAPSAAPSQTSTKAALVALPYTARAPTQPTQSTQSGAPSSPESENPNQRRNRDSSLSDHSVNSSRMFVPGREQDMGPLPPAMHEEEELAAHDDTLPPDYHQATEPLPGQRP